MLRTARLPKMYVRRQCVQRNSGELDSNSSTAALHSAVSGIITPATDFKRAKAIGLILEPYFKLRILLWSMRREKVFDSNVRWGDEHRLRMRQHVEAVFPVVVPHTGRPDTTQRHCLDKLMDGDLNYLAPTRR